MESTNEIPIENSRLSDASCDQALRDLQNGNRRALDSIFRVLWTAMVRFSKQRLGDNAAAEEAAAEAMKKVFERISDYDPTRPALPWILAIAAWECRSVATRKRRKREENLEDHDLPVQEVRLPDESVVQKEMEEILRASLLELYEGDRQMLLRAFFEEEQGMGSTARKQKERALKRLKDVFWRLYGKSI